MVRCGFSGDAAPRINIPNVVGHAIGYEEEGSWVIDKKLQRCSIFLIVLSSLSFFLLCNLSCVQYGAVHVNWMCQPARLLESTTDPFPLLS